MRADAEEGGGNKGRLRIGGSMEQVPRLAEKKKEAGSETRKGRPEGVMERREGTTGQRRGEDEPA